MAISSSQKLYEAWRPECCEECGTRYIGFKNNPILPLRMRDESGELHTVAFVCSPKCREQFLAEHEALASYLIEES